MSHVEIGPRENLPELSEADILLGRAHYRHYLAGVLILNRPNAAVAEGMLGEGMSVDDFEVEPLVAYAEDMMYHGLRGVIIGATRVRRQNLRSAENIFNDVYPRMQKIVDTSYRHDSDPIYRMNPAFQDMRPAPFFEEPLYRSLCHGRKDKIATLTLLDGFLPALSFHAILAGRMLSGERHTQASTSQSA